MGLKLSICGGQKRARVSRTGGCQQFWNQWRLVPRRPCSACVLISVTIHFHWAPVGVFTSVDTVWWLSIVSSSFYTIRVTVSTVRVVYFTLFWYPVGYVYLASVYVSDQCPGSFWAYNIVCQDPCDASSNRLHVDILQFCFLHLRYTVFSHYLDTNRVWVFGAGDSWHSLKIIHPRYRGWSGSNKKRPPMGLRADSFECDVTRLIRGLWLYFRNQIAQK